MSLVPSFVYCQDGRWYKNLVYRDETNDWFICFDDRDPVELVVKASKSSSLTGDDILHAVGIPCTNRSALKGCGSRMFRGKFHKARNCFLTVLNKPFPTPSEWCSWDEVQNSRPDREGVYYGAELTPEEK